MKKQIKILGVLAVALTLGLSACNGGGGGDSQGGKDGSSSKHQHTAAENAPWQHDDNRHWKDCVANDGGKVDNKAHEFEDVSIIKDSTCTEVGSKNVKCKVCGFETTKEIALKDHEYISDTSKTDVEPNCLEQGHTYTICKNCGLEHDEVLNALGHNWGEWEVTKAAKCEETGLRKHTCSRCNLVEDEVIPALGHKLVTKDTAEPEPGKAAVRVYDCENEGCDVTYFGFKATETSPNAGQLVEETDANTGDVGKRFWGRPIGNAMVLGDDGSAADGNVEKVYDPTVKGDLFEYVFTLTQEQINVMGNTVACYADAKPADYLGNQDFWACDPTAEEWTPGYYIEGENAGNPIADYRYILYVDGHPVEFDHRMTAPVTANGTGYQNQQNLKRGEFLMPYVFRFTPGEHSISLRMAGGYRSVFYNFIFRPYEVPAEIPVTPANVEIRVEETQQLNCSVEGVTYKSANTSIATVSDTGLVTGVKAGETSITVSKEGNYFPTTIPVKINEKAGIIKVEAETGVSSKDEGGQDLITFRDASGGRRVTDAFPKDAILTIAINADEADTYQMTIDGRRSYSDGATDMAFTSAFEIKVNDVAVTSEKAVSGTSWADYVIGNVALNAGANTLTLKALTEVNPINLDYFKFEPASALPPEPVDPWVLDTETVMPTPAADGALVKRYIQEGKDDVKYVIDVKTSNMTSADSDPWKTNPSTGEFKLNNGKTATFKFDLPKAFEGKMYQVSYIDSYNSNSSKKAFYETNNHANIEVKVNGGDALDLSPFAATTFKDLFNDELDGSNSVAKEIELGSVNLGTSNTVSYKRIETLNMIVKGFVFIGKDHVHANWTDGAKVEKTAETSAYQNGECSCGAKRVLIDVASDLNGKITKRGAKLGAKGDVAKYVFPVPADAVGKTAQLYFKATVDNAGNYNYNYYTGKNGGSSAVTLPDNKTNTEVKFNSNVVVLPTTSYKDLGMTGLDEAGAGTFLVNTVTLAASNELTLERLDSFGVQYYEIFVVYE